VGFEKKILASIDRGIAAIAALKEEENLLFIKQVSEVMARCYQNGNKILIAGNGGSLCDASHFAEELTGFFRLPRPALAAIALNDSAHITCVGNDVGFETIFSRSIEALGQSGDLFFGLSTSGNSPNIVNGFMAAKEKGLITIAMLGKGGGKLKGVADYELIIDGFATSDRIQEAHMTALHILVELVEESLFKGNS
jgi:D-sedoheptulose 7-phosphate isomerase